MKTPADILDRAAEIVDKGWTQGLLAVTSSGYATMHTDPEAVCFCAMGATGRAAMELGCPGLDALADTALADDLGVYVPHWNDAKGRTAAEVSAAMRRVAAKLRNENAPTE